MSFYKSGNIIPREFVSLSDKTCLVKAKDIQAGKSWASKNEAYFENLTDGEIKEEMKKMTDKIEELEMREKELKQKEMELARLEQSLKFAQEQLKKQKETWEIEKKREREKVEDEKKRMEIERTADYYKMKTFMWEKAVELAELIIRQKIDERSISVNVLMEKVLEKLPISFQSLAITVHPETLEQLKKERPKEYWVLSDIRWKYDYSLKFGEFIIEDENEYFDYTLGSIFSEIKQRLKKKQEKEGETGHD